MRMEMAFGGLIVAATAFGGAFAAPAGEPEPLMAESLRNLPVNKWVKLPCKAEPGYWLSGMVYVPGRGQLLHWGNTTIPEPGGGSGGSTRNDVRAFDPGLGDWVSDYPSDGKPGGGVGWSTMLPSGRPAASITLNGVCWDSKREQVVYTMRGLMAAYDPKTKTWKDLKARTVMPYLINDWDHGPEAKPEHPGGPPVYGVGTCYDPVNDEIVLFPHYYAKNVSMRDVTGQVTGHFGTFRYSFADNTWRVVSDTFGSDEVKAARKGLLNAMTKASAAMDEAWVLNRRPDAARLAEVSRRFEAAAEELGKLALPAGSRVEGEAPARAVLAPVGGLLKAAAAAVSGGKPGEAMKPARDALWAMNEALDGALRVEPPPRCAAPMVYDPKNKCIVMFGGQTNLARTDLDDPRRWLAYTALDDTWVYDCLARQWRELPCKARPPAQHVPKLTYDPDSGLILLAATHGGKISLWTLDVARGEWLKREEQDWADVTIGAGISLSTFGYDPVRRLALLTRKQRAYDLGRGVQETWVLRLDLARLPGRPAPAWVPPPPIKPQEVPAEDPAWVAKLKELPSNTWVWANPVGGETPARDWGNISYDAARDWVVYFGGGHSTYQINNVAIYPVGANKWVTTVGDDNGFVPPNYWEGTCTGHRGGPPTGHQRNTYQTLDGRMYHLVGAYGRGSNYTEFPDPDCVYFYDIDRGGVWREQRIATINRPDEFVRQVYSALDHFGGATRTVQLADPSGRIMDILFLRTGYYSPRIVKAYFRCYDANDNNLTIREIPAPFPSSGVSESRPFCYVPDRDQILYCQYNWNDKTTEGAKVTWVYDIKTNRFIDLKPKRDLPGLPAVIEYVPRHKVALAFISGRWWVYSFEKNDWAQLETHGVQITHNQGPYGQMVWTGKHGVFVFFDRRTMVMRPDFGQVKWE